MDSIDTLNRLVNGLPLVEDGFQDGTVIHWTQSGCLDAAIKTPAGWTTTASEDNKAQPQVPRTLDFEALAALLALDKVTYVGVLAAVLVVKGDAPCGS
jgi:hypothetical protein